MEVVISTNLATQNFPLNGFIESCFILILKKLKIFQSTMSY